MTEKEKYILSTYQPVKTIRETESSKVELVESSLNSGKYIKKTYNSDKRTVYNSLSKIKSTHIPEVYTVNPSPQATHFFTHNTRFLLPRSLQLPLNLFSTHTVIKLYRLPTVPYYEQNYNNFRQHAQSKKHTIRSLEM